MCFVNLQDKTQRELVKFGELAAHIHFKRRMGAIGLSPLEVQNGIMRQDGLGLTVSMLTSADFASNAT